MEFAIKRSDLVRELSLAQGVVEKKTTIPILSNVLLETSGDRVVLTTTDLELSVRSVCPAQVLREGAGTIPAKRLLDYVRLLPEAAVAFKFSENQWASLVCGRSKTRIAGMSRDTFPDLPPLPDQMTEIPVGVLTSMISRTIFAISVEESRFTLNGALLVLGSGRATMVATDGHRLALTNVQVENLDAAIPQKALLPRKAMGELMKLSQEAHPEMVARFGTDENHLFFQLGDRLLLSRRLTGTFPDYERVLPREHPHVVTLPREDFRAAIDRVAQFSDERSRAIRLSVEEGELKVYSSLSDTGESEESIPVEYEGPKVEVGFNAQYLSDFLRAVQEDQVLFYFKDAQSAGELRPVLPEGAKYDYRYIVMPMRI